VDSRSVSEPERVSRRCKGGGGGSARSCRGGLERREEEVDEACDGAEERESGVAARARRPEGDGVLSLEMEESLSRA
jgi:hypothetical protein